MSDPAVARSDQGAICKIWVHDESFARDHVLFNASAFPHVNVTNNPLVKVLAHQRSSANADASTYSALSEHDQKLHNAETPGLIFLARDCDDETKARHQNLQLSVSSRVAKLYNFKHHTEVSLHVADETTSTLTHVEIAFRDVYLTRADLHRMVSVTLLNQAVFEGQHVVFLGTIRATIKAIFIHGKRVRSGFYGSQTKPIFRSESARYVVYIQMSREMWDFDTEGSGDIIFNKVINHVLPELFRKWSDLSARHVISVILFTRLESIAGKTSNMHKSTLERDNNSTGNAPTGPQPGRDFYRVVVSELSSGEWETILHELKKEFRIFLRDVLMTAGNIDAEALTDDPVAEHISTGFRGITGRPAPAMEGNILEALNLASSRFYTDWVDPDLFRSGLSIMVITPGTGFFEVDRDMLKLTTENLVKNGVGIDLLCLSERPLHEVPVFGFRRYFPTNYGLDAETVSTVRRNSRTGETLSAKDFDGIDPAEAYRNAFVDHAKGLRYHWTFVVPQWIQVHFCAASVNYSTRPSWNFQAELKDSRFIPKCRMYEVQMTGLMENEMSNISIPTLDPSKYRHSEASMHEASSILSNTSRRSSMIAGSPNRDIRYQKPIKISVHKPNQLSESSLYKEKDDSSWMDEYDKSVFVMPERNWPLNLSPTKVRGNDATERHPGLGHRIRDGDSAVDSLSSSPSLSVVAAEHNSIGRPRSKPHYRTLLGERSLKRRDSKESMHSQTPSRHASSIFPFGGNAWIGGKAVASTQYSSESATIAQTQYDRETSPIGDDDVSQSRTISEQVRNTLSRQPPQKTASEHSSPAPRPDSARTIPVDVPQAPALKEKREPEQANLTFVRRQNNTKSTMAIPVQNPIYERSLENRSMAGPGISSASKKALSPWLPSTNASRPGDMLAGMGSNLGWAHTFVRPPQDFGIKWKSICCPAILPLSSDYMPTPDILRSYEESAYKVTIPDDDLVADVSYARAHLLNRMVSFRLAKGFQMLPRASVKSQGKQIQFEDELYKEDGIAVLMSKGDTIHSLCASGSDIQVIRYRPSEAMGTIPTSGLTRASFRYSPAIRTTFSKRYEMTEVSIAALPNRLNWSLIDNYLAGYMDEFTESCGFWRARFVLIPVEPPTSSRRPLPAQAEDSDDEIHIEGIQRLTQLWQRAQYIPATHLEGHANLQMHKDHKDVNPNPLNLEFQTRDISAVLTAGLHDFLLYEEGSNAPSTQLFSDAEKYGLSKVDLRKLATHLQGDKGIKVQDRRWYFRFHKDCFVGLDLTSWLLYNFQDVTNREEAARVGQSLMEKGLFKHVSGRHRFRDGNFFYTLAPEYRVPRADSRSSWFSRKPDRGSVPSTPHVGALNEAPPTPNLKLGKFEISGDLEKSTSHPEHKLKRPKVRLSSMIQCDVSSRRKSDRPEFVNVHYDRLCNPDSCYHFRLEWMETTAKLVEDFLSSWASTAERYGLKLVEVPIAEACTIIETNPFRSPYVIELAVPPPAAKIEQTVDSLSLTPQGKGQNFLFHRALLRKFGFVLDVEAASNFPPDIDITFSWGRQKLYKYAQYIHKTGVLLAQVTDEGKFLLLANRLATNRSTLAREAAKHDKRDGARDDRGAPPPPGQHQRSRPSTGTAPKRSALTSPIMSATMHDHVVSPPGHVPEDTKATPPPTAEQLRDDFEAFCHDATALTAFYDDLAGRDATISTRSTPMLSARDAPGHGAAASARETPVLEAAIPNLELPVNSRFELSPRVAPVSSQGLAIHEEGLLEEGDEEEAW